jgi:hypothetical protein
MPAVLPNMADVTTLPADRSFHPAVLSPWRTWSHGLSDSIHAVCCCIPATSVISSPPSVTFFFDRFMVKVLSKVGVAHKVPACMLSVVLFRWAPNECLSEWLSGPDVVSAISSSRASLSVFLHNKRRWHLISHSLTLSANSSVSFLLILCLGKPAWARWAKWALYCRGSLTCCMEHFFQVVVTIAILEHHSNLFKCHSIGGSV